MLAIYRPGLVPGMVLSNCEFHYGFTITLSPLGRPGVGQGHPGSGDRVNTKMSPAWRREGDIGTAPLRTRLIRGGCASGKKTLFIIAFIGSSADMAGPLPLQFAYSYQWL